jgi:hyperosmotically inducible periplasmic protein
MKNKYSFRLIVPAILFGMVMSVPAFAQDSSVPASQDMHQAGQAVENAGSNTAAAATDAYHGTARAVKDTTITAEVKTALKRDQMVRSQSIHVNTIAGVVTLKGNVPSPEIAAHAAQVAAQSKGVQSVNNQLMVVSSSASSQ